jgi:hypothetical protein
VLHFLAFVCFMGTDTNQTAVIPKLKVKLASAIETYERTVIRGSSYNNYASPISNSNGMEPSYRISKFLSSRTSTNTCIKYVNHGILLTCFYTNENSKGIINRLVRAGGRGRLLFFFFFSPFNSSTKDPSSHSVSSALQFFTIVSPIDIV